MAGGEDERDEAGRGVFVPARWIPAPATVSPEARAFLSDPPDLAGQSPAATDDAATWRAYAAGLDGRKAAAAAAAIDRYPATITPHRIGAAALFEIAPRAMTGDDDLALLYLHGGAFVMGGGIAAAHAALALADAARMRTFSIDYRMPPDHPFPTGLDDAVEAYRWLLERYAPGRIAVAGVSAGGGLAAAMVLRARDCGLPLPAACILATPEADLTESGDTFTTNDTVDVVLKHRLTESIALYAAGHDLRDPHLSPVFGDFAKGFPPTLLLSGTRDLFLSNTVRLHRAMLGAGIAAELHVWEAMPHGGFLGAPEDGELLDEQARFLRRRLPLAPA